MDKEDALLVAQEAFGYLMRNAEELKTAYEFICDEMDISDEEMREAFKLLFDKELE